MACLLMFMAVASASTGKKELKIGLMNLSNGTYDLTTIYLDFGTSPAYNSLEDAAKVFNPSPIVPQLYSITTDNYYCQTNGYGPFVNTVSIPLGFEVDSGGTYRIFCNLIDNFEPTCLIRLYDQFTSLTHDLRSNYFNFSIPHATQDNNRFLLLVSFPPVIQLQDASCTNNDGVISIQQDPSVTWSLCQLYNSSNTLVGSYSNITGNFQFTGLPEGNYTLAFVYNSYVTTQAINLNGHYVTNQIGVSKTIASVGEQLQFFSLTGNATQFEWDLGDGSIIVGITHPQFAYYEPGTYMVVMRAYNVYGCEAFDTLYITILPSTGIPESEKPPVRVSVLERELIIHKPLPEHVSVTLYHINGQAVLNRSISDNSETRIPLVELPAGVYLLQLQQGSWRYVRKVLIP
ncbi:MAG: T9SS type A sorting domain-containing protein [Chitinophagales bacterium]|nr:T9SS type A sorting domain-containing protein [Chitinophagales bacterium]MDW8419812.1 T9SS type A sorting domain-containing protein [Chitinophagales bacterium]